MAVSLYLLRKGIFRYVNDGGVCRTANRLFFGSSTLHSLASNNNNNNNNNNNQTKKPNIGIM